MNHLNFLLVFIVLLLSSCRKDLLHWQSVERISISPSTQLNNAYFLSNGIGLLCGGARFEKAMLYQSSDNGATWQQIPTPNEAKGLFGLAASPNNKLYFSGMYMNICSSSDILGPYRSQALSSREEFISAISMGEDAFAVGVTALGTDSGAVIRFDSALNLLSFQRFKNALWDIKMFDAQKGIAVGSGTIMSTKDGAKTWQKQSVMGDNFNSISAIDSNIIFVSGLSGFIVKTNDGGKTWKRLRNGSNITLVNYQIWDILAINPQQIYAVGEGGLVIHSDDGGEHWMEFDKFTKDNLRFISLCPDGKLLVGGENGSLFRINF